LTDLRTTRTSGTLLSVASGVVMVSGISYLIPAGTVGIVAGTGTVRIGVDTSVTPPTGKVYYTAGLTVTCAGMGSCTAPVPGAAFGVDDLQLVTWTATSGVFDSNGGTELRGMLSRNRTLTGAGMISSTSGHTQTISVNTAVIPIFTLTPGTGSALASGATIAPANRVHHVTGTSAISTISAAGMTDGEILTLVADGAFTTTTAGNIGLAVTTSVGQSLRLVFDSIAAKWYPASAGSGSGGGGPSSLVKEYAGATCQSGSGSLGLNTFTADSPIPDCTIGTNVVFGVAKFPNDKTYSMQGSFAMPASVSTVSLDLWWQANVANAGLSAVWQLQTACVASGASNDPVFNTAQSVSSAAASTAYKLLTAQIAAVSSAGCGGKEFFFRIFRTPGGSDTLAATAELKSLRFIIQ